MICGIDPGNTGGLCAINDAGEIACVTPMPLMSSGKRKVIDLATIARFMSDWSIRKVYIEKVFTRPGDGRLGVLRYAEGAFKVEGLLFGVNVPCEQVTPQAWMKTLGIKASKDVAGSRTKKANIERAQLLWPEQTWLASPRCSTIHTGMVDAALIAFYGNSQEAGAIAEAGSKLRKGS